MTRMGRILAIDYGRRRVGLAVTDPLGLTAQGLPTLIIEQPADIITWIADNRREWDIEKIIIGYPRSLSGHAGPMAQEVGEFAEQVGTNIDLPVELVDERLTSREAHTTFAASGRKLKGHKEKIDQISAVILLQHYLEMTQTDDQD